MGSWVNGTGENSSPPAAGEEVHSDISLRGWWRERTAWVGWGMGYVIKHVSLFFQSFFAGTSESEECGCGLGLCGCPVPCFLQKMPLVIFLGVEKVSTCTFGKVSLFGGSYFCWCLGFRKYYHVACKMVRSFLLTGCSPSSGNWSVSEPNPFREKSNISCALIYF